MATLICKTKVRKNGLVALPKAMREQLHLREGDEVELAVSIPSVPAEVNSEENPLLKIIGIGKNGGKRDGGVNHDKYLYGSDPL